MITETAKEIIQLSEKMKDLKSFIPREGYDDIGKRLSEIVIEPRDIEVSNKILHEIEYASLGIANFIRNVSIDSEIALEAFYSQKLIDEKSTQSLFTRIMNNYPYDWYKKRSILENSLIPESISKPNILIIGVSGIPHTGLSLSQIRNCDITWLDPYKNTYQVGHTLLKTMKAEKIKEAECIRIIPLGPDGFSQQLRYIKPHSGFDIAYLTDTRIFSLELFSAMHELGVPAIGCSINHGLCQLLYHNPDYDDIAPFYDFDRGYYPPNILNMSSKGWIMSDALSYGSLGFFKRKP